MNILHINACVRELSRTKKLADYVLQKLNGQVVEINLEQANITPLTDKMLLKRDELIAHKNYDDEMFDNAKLFKQADVIVISAPFWDFSFPASLKCFIENININGLIFSYSKEGIPQGLCNAKNLIYVTTAGGFISNDEYGFGYIKTLAKTFYGIENVYCIKAEGLDIFGADVESILQKAKHNIDEIFPLG